VTPTRRFAVHSTARTARYTALAAALLLIDAALFSSPARAADGPLTCGYTFNSWRGGFSANLTVRNAGPTISGWTAAWTVPDPTVNENAWGANALDTPPTRLAFSNATWNGTIPTGTATTFGWIAKAVVAEVPSDITVNGVACPVTG
jgi:endoglucanase